MLPKRSNVGVGHNFFVCVSLFCSQGLDITSRWYLGSKKRFPRLLTTSGNYLRLPGPIISRFCRGLSNREFFLGGGVAGRFEKWSIASLIRVQIAQELVRLITLIGLNKFLIHIISPRPLKIFSWTTFRWSVLRKCEFLVVLRLL